MAKMIHVSCEFPDDEGEEEAEKATDPKMPASRKKDYSSHYTSKKRTLEEGKLIVSGLGQKRRRTQTKQNHEMYQKLETTPWTHEEKVQLLNALKQYKPDDLASICPLIETRCEAEVDSYIRKMTKMAKGNNIPEYDSGTANTPIELWLQATEDLMESSTDFSKVLAQVWSLMASCEDHGAELKPSSRVPDYHALYHYISCILADKPLPKLKSLEASIMVELINDLAHQLTVRDTAQQQTALENKYRLLAECTHRCGLVDAGDLIRMALQQDFAENGDTPEHLIELAKANPQDNKHKPPPIKKTTLYSLNPLCIPVKSLRPNLKPGWHTSAVPEIRDKLKEDQKRNEQVAEKVAKKMEARKQKAIKLINDKQPNQSGNQSTATNGNQSTATGGDQSTETDVGPSVDPANKSSWALMSASDPVIAAMDLFKPDEKGRGRRYGRQKKWQPTRADRRELPAEEQQRARAEIPAIMRQEDWCTGGSAYAGSKVVEKLSEAGVRPRFLHRTDVSTQNHTHHTVKITSPIIRNTAADAEEDAQDDPDYKASTRAKATTRRRSSATREKKTPVKKSPPEKKSTAKKTPTEKNTTKTPATKGKRQTKSAQKQTDSLIQGTKILNPLPADISIEETEGDTTYVDPSGLLSSGGNMSEDAAQVYAVEACTVTEDDIPFLGNTTIELNQQWLKGEQTDSDGD